MGRVRALWRLRAKELDKLGTGDHEDGGGLRLRVDPSGARRWVLRVTINGKRRYRGLGSYPLVSIERARDEAHKHRLAARDGHDLREERKREAALATTFRQTFDTFFANKRKELEGSRHLMQWTSQMRDYVFPKIGSKPVGDVTHADIIEVLEPIWYKKPETAKRVLQRVALVFESAIRRGQREKANPCNGIAQELGPRHQEVEHRRAMPYAEVPAFIRQLRTSQAKSAPAFEWLILTATRSGETRLALWSEIDEEAKIWTIPAKRMKMKRAHVVPLCRRCLEILKKIRTERPPVGLLFPGTTGGPMSDMTLTKLLRDWGLADGATVHGFRSSFKDWCAEVAKVRDEVSEAALAHSVRGGVRAAYLRTEFLHERLGVMQRWADYCAQRHLQLLPHSQAQP